VTGYVGHPQVVRVNMEIGIDSVGGVVSDTATSLKLSPVLRTQNLLEEIELADKVGLDVLEWVNTIVASL
jgi:hypothetical protein